MSKMDLNSIKSDSAKRPTISTTEGKPPKISKRICTYKDIFRKYPKDVDELIEEVLFFYTSTGFKWGSGIVNGLISKSTTKEFKDEFNRLLDSLSSNYDYFTKEILKRIFYKFTNSDMFERIYYRTNPLAQCDCENIYEGINKEEKEQFLESFWDGLNKLISFHKEKLSEKNFMVAIFSMTH